MSVENFLATLNKVRKTGPDRWIACCPAHDDRHPSMTISTGRNGGVVVKCHSQGCSFESIVDSTGIDPAEMFPPKSDGYDFKPPERRPVHAEDALKAVAHEMTVGFLIFRDLHKLLKGFDLNPLNSDNHERLGLVVERINSAVELATGASITAQEEAQRIIKAGRLRPHEEKDIEEFVNA